MINIIYNNSIFDSILGKEIFVDFLQKNNSTDYIELECNNIDIAKLTINENDIYYIFGYNNSKIMKRFIQLISKCKVAIFECNSYYVLECKKLIAKLSTNNKIELYTNINKSISVQILCYLYNPHNLLNVSFNILDELSAYITNNYDINKEYDLLCKYLTIYNKYKSNNSYISNIINNALTGEGTLFTTKEYNATGNIIKNTYFTGYSNKNLYIINSTEDLCWENIKDHFNDNNFVLIFNKIAYNTNLVKIYFIEKDINSLEVDKSNILDNTVYTMFITDSNKYINIIRINDEWYEHIITYSGRYINKKLNINKIEDYKLYDNIVFSLSELNTFNSVECLKSKYKNANGNKNVATSILTDTELNLIFKTSSI